MVSVRKNENKIDYRYSGIAYPCNKLHCCTFRATFTKLTTYTASAIKSNFGNFWVYNWEGGNKSLYTTLGFAPGTASILYFSPIHQSAVHACMFIHGCINEHVSTCISVCLSLSLSLSLSLYVNRAFSAVAGAKHS